MTDYVAEAYLSGVSAFALERVAARARRAERDLAQEGVDVRYVRSVFLRSEETCFHFVEAPSEGAVREFMTRADIDFDRIGPVVTAEAGKGGTQ
jgi:hypothetical protein